MKTCLCAALTFGFQAFMADAQILRYEFNEGVGTTTASSGSAADSMVMRDATGTPTTALWGAVGSGISGSPTDLALDLTTATGMGTSFVGPNAFLPALSLGTTLNQFTLTGWFRPDSGDLGRASFLTIQNGNDTLNVLGLSGGPVGARSRLRLILDDGDTFPEVDASGDFESQWSTAEVWAFFAIAYDGQGANTAQFYSGDLSVPVSLSASSPVASVLFPVGGASIWMGAVPSNSDPFDGYLDDFRFYDSALSASGIEQVRLSAVPEPKSTLLLLFCALLFVRRWLTAGHHLTPNKT